ncbi:expressed protein [Phakopsora pachyrhizi]|uniref:Expressed protein n=1 Tax=Phakopsora pachyrhizi TaxID=170000 RepID=A0AAV0BPN8_PHAPC|nr:expressed protein [Phakopsora pachyrhizi]
MALTSYIGRTSERLRYLIGRGEINFSKLFAGSSRKMQPSLVTPYTDIDPEVVPLEEITSTRTQNSNLRIATSSNISINTLYTRSSSSSPRPRRGDSLTTSLRNLSTPDIFNAKDFSSPEEPFMESSDDLTTPKRFFSRAMIKLLQNQLSRPISLIKLITILEISRGGILPVVLSGVGGHFKSLESDQRVVLGPIPQSKLNRYHVSGQAYLLRDSFSSNHTMLQQGFTADVKCRQRRVSAPDRPSLLSSPQVIDFPGTNSSDSLNYTLFRWSFDARCPDEERVNVSSLIIAIGTPFSNGGLVAVTLCPDQDLSGNKSPGNHLLTFLGAGDGYGFLDSTVCEFKTKITTVQVEYGRSIAIKNITSERKIGSENSKISRLILSLIDSMISQSQTIYTSGFGDVIKTIYNSKSSQPISTTYISSGNGANATLLNEVMYIRASFSAKDIFPNDELPINSRIDVSGRWDSETMGWDRTQKKLESGLTLIPIILVGLSSILAIIWPNPGSGIDQRESLNSKLDEFNPDNLVELLVAASIGGKYNDKDEDAEKTRGDAEIEDRFEDCEDERSSRFKSRNLEGIMGPSDKVALLKHPNNLLWQLKLD